MEEHEGTVGDSLGLVVLILLVSSWDTVAHN